MRFVLLKQLWNVIMMNLPDCLNRFIQHAGKPAPKKCLPTLKSRLILPKMLRLMIKWKSTVKVEGFYLFLSKSIIFAPLLK